MQFMTEQNPFDKTKIRKAASAVETAKAPPSRKLERHGDVKLRRPHILY